MLSIGYDNPGTEPVTAGPLYSPKLRIESEVLMDPWLVDPGTKQGGPSRPALLFSASRVALGHAHRRQNRAPMPTPTITGLNSVVPSLVPSRLILPLPSQQHASATANQVGVMLTSTPTVPTAPLAVSTPMHRQHTAPAPSAFFLACLGTWYPTPNN